MVFKILTIIVFVFSSFSLNLLHLPSTEAKLNLHQSRFVHPESITRANKEKRDGAPKKQGDNNTETSTTLDPKVIQSASNSDGGDPKFFPSAKSTNNFINFCATAAGKVDNAILMNGAQTKAKAACNPIPMGMVPSQDKFPTCKFFSPTNLDKILEKTTFNISITVKNLIAGKFTNPANTYYSAPAHLDPSGIILGHLHVVINKIDHLNSTALFDPLKFQFFKGVDTGADKDGRVTVEVKDGLPAGFYRMATIMTAANHQAIGASLAQRGHHDDMIYIVSVDKAHFNKTTS